MQTCRICKNSNNNNTYLAREMMFGYYDEFEYFLCSNCGCLQISDVPNDISKYYPENYYSFSKISLSNTFIIKSFLKRQCLKYYYGERNFLGMILFNFLGEPNLPKWAKKSILNTNFQILDVGSGIGNNLLTLMQTGFTKLIGIDPYIKSDLHYNKKLCVLKKEVFELDNQFDFIMLHHSFEHMPDPLNVVKKLYQILRNNRFVLIRIPIVPSYAWEKYKTNWVQLDAPRHLFLHSIKSMQIIAESVGFNIVDIDYDSNAFQIWGSEQYKNGIPLNNRRSYATNPEDSIFSQDDIIKFEKKASELNESKNGDQACFYLYKKD